MRILATALLAAAAPARAVEATAAAGAAQDGLGQDVLLRLSGGLLLVLVLVFVAAWAVRRLGRLPAGGNGSLRVLGGIAVGQRERVVLIEAGEQRLLLGVAPGRVAMLHALPARTAQDAPEEPVDAGPAAPASFNQRLGALLGRNGAVRT